MAERVRAASGKAARISLVLAAARRVDAQGRAANANYNGYVGPAKIPDGLHNSASLLHHSLSGVTPWNIGAVAFSREVIAEMGSFLLPEIGLCADIDVVLRAASYGDVLYIDTPLMEFTVRADGDSHTSGVSPQAWNNTLSSLGAALVSVLALHEVRRKVSREERLAVRAAVAHAQLQRAFQHRYRPGGSGRRGAVRDVIRAIGWSPKTVLRPQNLVYALAAILSPRGMIQHVRNRVLKRLYRSEFDTGSEVSAGGVPSATQSQLTRNRTARESRRWKTVLAAAMSWLWFD